MTFEINGANGVYDNKITDESIRYGRNAADNHKELVVSTLVDGATSVAPMLDYSPTAEAFQNNINKLEKFADENDTYLNSLPPLQYEYRYMPKADNGNIDKKALLGAAYEEMGRNYIPVKKFEESYLPNTQEYTAAPLDIDKDGNIDTGEYSASMLAADMFSKPNPSISAIDGSMNSKGMDMVMEYARKSNAEAATKLYSQIYNKFNLNELA